jgi:hypothetical protein
MSEKTWKVEDFKIRYTPATAYEEATYLVDHDALSMSVATGRWAATVRDRRRAS